MKIILNFILFSILLIENISAHWHTAYSHDGHTKNRNSMWMKAINNKTLLRDMSLPGTHNSMAFYGGDAVKCQNMPLDVQLRSGIRVFDIRCRHYNNKFSIHHGLVYQRASFNDVMNIMRKFLKENPSETLLMRVSENYKPGGNRRSFEDTFIWYHKLYNKYIWTPTGRNPTIGATRGKVVILQDFNASKFYGLDYRKFKIQDEYKLKTNWDLYSKWEKIKKHLNSANTCFKRNFYVNFLSGSTGSFPYFVASGHVSPGTSAARLVTGRTTPGWKNSWPDFPRLNCFIGICSIHFEGTNILTHEFLKSNKPTFVGIVMADFPGDGLINAIIKLNMKYKS